MSNPDFNDDVNKRRHSAKPPPTSTPGKPGKMKEKTASWGGLPGETGPNRSGGVKPAKIHPKSEGL